MGAPITKSCQICRFSHTSGFPYACLSRRPNFCVPFHTELKNHLLCEALRPKDVLSQVSQPETHSFLGSLSIPLSGHYKRASQRLTQLGSVYTHTVRSLGAMPSVSPRHLEQGLAHRSGSVHVCYMNEIVSCVSLSLR